MLVASLTARKHERMFPLCHDFATRKELWENEPPGIKSNGRIVDCCCFSITNRLQSAHRRLAQSQSTIKRHAGSIFEIRESSQLADGPRGRSSSAPKRDDQTTEESLELQCNLVITVGVIFKHGIDTTLLNIGGGQIWPGSQRR